MGILARDTARKAEKAQIEILRALPAWKKLELVADACETNRMLLLAGLRSRCPDASEAELQQMLISLLAGEESSEKIRGRFSVACQ